MENETKKSEEILFTPHFSLKELSKTKYATPDENKPGIVAVENLRTLCFDWLEELRLRYNLRYVIGADDDYETSDVVEPLVINSGYRNYEVNKAAGGSPNSNHLTGCAVDIRCIGVEQQIRYAALLLDIADETGREFDELFLEHKGTNYWIHLTSRPTHNRGKVKMIG